MADFFDRFLEEQLIDPDFRKAWEESKVEYELANQIIKLRKEKGWTQEDLAKQINTGQSYISRVENGDHSITLHTLGKIAKALGVDLSISFEKKREIN